MKGTLDRARSGPASMGLTVDEVRPPSSQAMLNRLLAASIVLREDWEQLSTQTREEVSGASGPKELFALLVQHELLTEYQAARVEAGTTFGLVMGNYRVLDRLGAGGMGVVFKAEHIDIRRPVAIKLLAASHNQDEHILRRFLSEVRVVAQLQHPNIVQDKLGHIH